MDEGTLRAALRQRTRQLHARLDGSLSGPDGQVADLPGYVRVLRTLHALHAVADRPLARWAQRSPLAEPLTASALPDRAPSYAADLAVLGEPVPVSRRTCSTATCMSSAVDSGPTPRSGDTMLLVSDGMFERRDEAVDVSLDRLGRHLLDAGRAGLEPAAVLQRLVEMARPQGSEDDATLLLARRV